MVRCVDISNVVGLMNIPDIIRGTTGRYRSLAFSSGFDCMWLSSRYAMVSSFLRHGPVTARLSLPACSCPRMMSADMHAMRADDTASE